MSFNFNLGEGAVGAWTVTQRIAFIQCLHSSYTALVEALDVAHENVRSLIGSAKIDQDGFLRPKQPRSLCLLVPFLDLPCTSGRNLKSFSALCIYICVYV